GHGPPFWTLRCAVPVGLLSDDNALLQLQYRHEHYDAGSDIKEVASTTAAPSTTAPTTAISSSTTSLPQLFEEDVGAGSSSIPVPDVAPFNVGNVIQISDSNAAETKAFTNITSASGLLEQQQARRTTHMAVPRNLVVDSPLPNDYLVNRSARIKVLPDEPTDETQDKPYRTGRRWPWRKNPWWYNCLKLPCVLALLLFVDPNSGKTRGFGKNGYGS
ncbi:unnamed protein product, partial [Symbiodinium sp. CCMP2592]